MSSLLVISLTSPLLLWGMAAISLPILAHLLNRRVRRRIVFPTLKLLREAAASQSRTFRLRRWIVLLLRCAAVVLLAWAFARPMWVGAQAGAAGGDAQAVVIVLDVSASAGQRLQGVRAIQRMAGAAERLLDDLEPGRDLANFVYAGAAPRSAYPAPIVNLDALRQELGELGATEERADLPAAVATARAMLHDHAGPRRIFVISDMQKSNWHDAQGLLGDEAMPTTIVPIGQEGATNMGLLRPAVHPARPITGQPATVSVGVANYASYARPVRLIMSVNGTQTAERRLSLEPGQLGQVSLDLMLDEPGTHSIVLSVSGDDLESDDRTYLAVEALERIPVAIVADDDMTQPTGSGYFISRALSPQADRPEGLEVRRWFSNELTPQRLREVEAVIFGDVHRLSDAAIAAVTEYIDRGGGVVVVLGEGPVAANLAAIQRQAGDRTLIPFQPLERMHAGRQNPAWYFGDGLWSSVPLRSFDEVAKLSLGEIPFTRIYAAGELASGAQVLLGYTDGTPALAAMDYGRGRFVIANFTPAPTGGALAKHGAFVALLHGIVDDVRPRAAQATAFTVGQPLTYTFASDSSGRPALTVADPGDRELRLDIIDSGMGVWTVRTAPTRRAGFHVLMHQERPVAWLAVNVDERESDLRRTAPPAPPETTARGIGPATPRGAAPSAAEPLWGWFVIAACIAIALELVLLVVWQR